MNWFSILFFIAVLTTRAFTEQRPHHTKTNYEQATITMKTIRVTATPSKADVADSTDTNQDKVNVNTEYGRVTVTVHTKMSPNDLAGGTDLGTKDVKRRTGLSLADAELRKDLSREDVALHTDVGLDDVTLHTDVGLDDVTLHTDVLPEDVTLHMDVGLEIMTLHMDVGLDDVTLNTDVGLDDVTLNTVVGPEDVTLHTDVGLESSIVHREHNQDTIFRREPEIHDESIAIEPYHMEGNTLWKKTEKFIKHREPTNSERANKREMYDSEHNKQGNAPTTTKYSYSVIISLFLATFALACVMVVVIFRRSKYFPMLRRRWEHFNQSSYYPREYEMYHRNRMRSDDRTFSNQESRTTSSSSEEIDN